MTTRQCPGCGSAMQVLRSGEVDVDRCMMCGGLWLDRGELGKLVGRVKPRPGATESRRRCLSCDDPLRELRVQQVRLDVCAACGGMFLDDGELDELAKRHVKLRREVEGKEPALTFRCPGCGEEHPLVEGMTTNLGMSCARCFGSLSHGSVSSGYPVGANAYGSEPDCYGGSGYGDHDTGVGGFVTGAVNADQRGGTGGFLSYLGVQFLVALLSDDDDD